MSRIGFYENAILCLFNIDVFVHVQYSSAQFHFTELLKGKQPMVLYSYEFANPVIPPEKW